MGKRDTNQLALNLQIIENIAIEPIQNVVLVDSGIQNEKSDIRVHVGVKVKRVFIFRREDAIRAIKLHEYRRGMATTKTPTGDIITGIGFLVPPEDIDNCLVYEIPIVIMSDINFQEKDNTSEKGVKAQKVLKTMYKSGIIPREALEIEPDIDENLDEQTQIGGTDMIITQKARIQIKCDWAAGPRHLGGTGNLFLQIQECNPYQRI